MSRIYFSRIGNFSRTAQWERPYIIFLYRPLGTLSTYNKYYKKRFKHITNVITEKLQNVLHRWKRGAGWANSGLS